MDLLEWDAATYDSLPLPHERWGEGVIERLGPAPGQTVLDLGCGTGRDAVRVLEAAAGSRVVGVDGSEQMLARCRERLAGYGDRVRLVEADLRQPLTVGEPVDAAMSVAALHWLPDHSTVFESVARALRPGGWLVAECGGHGNIDGVRRAVRRVDDTAEPEAWEFAGVDDTTERLLAAGFVDVAVGLVDDPCPLRPGAQLEAFLATVVLGAHLREMTAERRLPFVQAVAGALREPVIDYVRLQFQARRPG